MIFLEHYRWAAHGGVGVFLVCRASTPCHRVSLVRLRDLGGRSCQPAGVPTLPPMLLCHSANVLPPLTVLFLLFPPHSNSLLSLPIGFYVILQPMIPFILRSIIPIIYHHLSDPFALCSPTSHHPSPHRPPYALSWFFADKTDCRGIATTLIKYIGIKDIALTTDSFFMHCSLLCSTASWYSDLLIRVNVFTGSFVCISHYIILCPFRSSSILCCLLVYCLITSCCSSVFYIT